MRLNPQFANLSSSSMGAMQSITDLFVVNKALSLQGQTTFQRLAGWVLQHNPQPEVPFQVDGDRKNKLVLGYP